MALSTGRVSGLDTLRGLAALAVCWHHFVGNSLIGDGLLRNSGAYGWLGVEVFFVISGFIIPLSLQRDHYNISHYRTFLLKRLVRLYPPYFASLAVTLVLLISYAIYKGSTTLGVDAQSLLLHLGLLNDFTGHKWINSIYWTLAIEIQFYLVVGLIFPALLTKRAAARRMAYLVLILPVVSLPSSSFLFRYVFLFLMGIVTLQAASKLMGRFEFVSLLAGLFTLSIYSLGIFAALAGLVTALIIHFRATGFRFFNTVGELSYSLYLLHGSVGSLILFLLLKFVVGPSTAGKTAAVFLAIAASLGIAAIAYRYIERNAIKYSSALRYRPLTLTTNVRMESMLSTPMQPEALVK